MPKTADRAQAIVIGGGPAGAAAAIVLAEAGVEVLVLEASAGPQAKVGESLPPSVNPILARLRLEVGAQRAALPSRANRSRWGSAELIEREFFFGSAGVGWRLDRMRFEAELAAAAVGAGVDWRYGHRLIGATADRAPAGPPTAGPVTVDSATAGPVTADSATAGPASADSATAGPAPAEASGWSLTVECAAGRRQFAASMVIDASGRAARFARLVGVRRVRYDRLVGVVGYGEPALSHDGSEREPSSGSKPDRPNPHPGLAADSSLVIEAVPTGWWYSLWLPDRRLAIAYLTDGDLLRQSGLLPLDRKLSTWLQPDSAAADLLGHAPTTRGRIQQAGLDAEWSQPQIRPAHAERSTLITGPGWLAVGEAAICFDPLSSYGITAALGAGIYAGKAAIGHLAGEAAALGGYAGLVDETFAKYLIMCHDRYAAEQRWPAATFWRRRHNPRRPSRPGSQAGPVAG